MEKCPVCDKEFKYAFAKEQHINLMKDDAHKAYREQIVNSNSQQNQQSYPTNEFTPQIMEKAEEMVQEEEDVREEAKKLLEKKKREKIINEYFDNAIRPKFVSGEWLTKEDHENLKQYYETEIKNLKQKHEREISDVSFKRFNEGVEAGSIIYCKYCGTPVPIEIAEQHGIPCPRCFQQQQQQIPQQDPFLTQLMLQSIVHRG